MVLTVMVFPAYSMQLQYPSQSFLNMRNISFSTKPTMTSNTIGSSTFGIVSHNVEHSTSFKAESDASAFTSSQVAQLKNIVSEAVATHLQPAVAEAVSAHLNRGKVNSNVTSLPAVNSSGVSQSGQPPSSDSQMPGVVHFMFLVNDDIPHSAMWAKFFADAREGHYHAFVHCRDSNGCSEKGLLSKLPNLHQVSTVGSWYCHDLVTAMVHLLKAAIDLRAAPEGTVEKFVWVSDSTLPLKPFSDIHQQLTSNDLSDFCISPHEQWADATIDGHALKLIKHHQWVVLNRKHAEILVKSWIPVDARAVWHVPLKGGSWKGKERDLSPQHFHYPGQTGSCADEWAIFATIFGAVEPNKGYRTYPGLSGPAINMWGPYSASTQGMCRTFSYWGNSDGELFANLGSQLAGEGNKLSCYPQCSVHPASIEWLSDAGLTALRASPFMFARKFSPNMPMTNYYNLVLSSDSSTAALLKIAHVSVPHATPSLESALATWQDKALKTYIRESARERRIRHPVKIAFVFMVYEEVRFAKLWEMYFSSVSPADYSVLVHAVDGERAATLLPDFFRKRLVTGIPKGEWCHFSKAQFALIRHAFADESITHLTWISGDAVPLQSMSTIRDVLQPPARSLFCIDHASQARAEMWTVLARPHALTLAQNEQSLWSLYTRFEACEDETVFYEPLKTLGISNDVLVDRCVMWSAWGTRKGKLNFDQQVSTLFNVSGTHHINSKQFERRNDSAVHPATFSSVPSDGLRLLLDLPDGYFFARKFTSDCVVEGGSHVKEKKLSDVLAQHFNLTDQSRDNIALRR